MDDKESITTIVTTIIKENPHLIDKTRIAHFYFDGSKKSINKLKTSLKAKNVQFEKSSVYDLVVVDTVTVNVAAIESKVAEYESLASAHGVIMDGFGIPIVDDYLEERPPVPDFDKYYSPGSMLAFKLSDGRFGYFIYLGGTAKSGGYIFDFIDYISNDLEHDVNAISNYPRLYRQPMVMWYIDPREVIYVGRVSIDYSKINANGIYYKVLMGMEDDQVLIDNGVYVEGEDFPIDREIDVLLGYVAAGRVFHLKNWDMIISYTFTKKGRCRVKQEYNIKMDDERLKRAYKFGIPLELKHIESRLLGENRDPTYLRDAVFK